VKYSRMLATFILLCLFATSIIEGQHQEPNKAKSCTIKGKVFRSDSNEAISNSYILLIQEKDSPAQVEHFDGVILRLPDEGSRRTSTTNACYTSS